MDFSTIALAASATVAATVATAACCMRDAKYNALHDAEQSHTATQSHAATAPRRYDMALNQSRASQDHIICYQGLVDTNGQKFDAICVFDGHGFNQCIIALRSMDLRQFFVQPNPCAAVFEACRGFEGGATMNLFRIYANRIENHNIGDSQAKVFMQVDGQWTIQAASVMHSPDNQAECARLDGRVNYSKSSPDLNNITGPNVITSNEPGIYVQFIGTPLRLALTQALGHKGLTGCRPEFFSVPIVQGQRYRAVNGSDGIWDVLGNFDHKELCTLSAQGIIDFVRARYAQEWNVTFGGVYANHPDQKYTMAREQWDDCSVGICDI